MSVKQVSICTAGECNGECYACRLKAVEQRATRLRDAAESAKAALSHLHPNDVPIGCYTIVRSAAAQLEDALKG